MPPRTLDSLSTPSTQGVNPQGSVAPNAYQQFNTNILGLLKESQKLGTAGFQNQSLNAQSAQANRISAPTPQNMIGASPGMQASVRSASAQAINPTIQGAQQSGATFSEQLANFGNLTNMAFQINQSYQQQQERAQDRAFSQIMAAIQTYGSGAFSGLQPDELKNLEKIAGLPTGFIGRIGKTLAEQQMEKEGQVTPALQAQLDLQKQQMAQQQSQFQAGQAISPYEQAQIDLERQRLAQQQSQFQAGQNQPQILGSAQTGYYSVVNGVATPLQAGQVSGGAQSTTPIDYTKHANESIEQYHARIAAARAGQPSPISPLSQPGAGDTSQYVVEANGRKYAVTLDAKGNLVSKVDLGAAKDPNPGTIVTLDGKQYDVLDR